MFNAPSRDLTRSCIPLYMPDVPVRIKTSRSRSGAVHSHEGPPFQVSTASLHAAVTSQRAWVETGDCDDGGGEVAKSTRSSGYAMGRSSPPRHSAVQPTLTKRRSWSKSQPTTRGSWMRWLTIDEARPESLNASREIVINKCKPMHDVCVGRCRGVYQALLGDAKRLALLMLTDTKQPVL